MPYLCSMPEWSAVLEAMLFAADAPLSAADLATMLAQRKDPEGAPSEAEISSMLPQIQAKYDALNLPFSLMPIAGGWQWLTRPAYAPYVRLTAAARDQKKLSRAALETLAIIAYKQPVTKAEIEFIRGVNCDYAVNRLLDRQLIEPAGRASLPGRPLLYRTTTVLLEHFGLNAAEDLPRLSDLKNDEEAVSEQFATRILESPTEPAA